MPLGDNLIEILSLRRGERSKTEVIDDKEIRPKELLDPLLPGLIRPGSMEAPEHLDRFHKQHLIASPAGLMTDGLGEVGFAYPGRTIDQDMFFPLNEAAGGQIRDQRTFDLRVKGKVEGL